LFAKLIGNKLSFMTKPKLSDDDVKQSFRWFARQAESAPFMAAIYTVLAEIGPSETCALHAHNERRKFASDLIAMAETERRDGTDQSTDNVERRNGTKATQRKSRRAGPAGRA
jgi:hypothetical protein